MAKVLIVGEAWGEQEALTKRPFIGPAGQEMRKMMKEAGLNPSLFSYTNVFNFRPEKNDIRTLCVPKLDAVKALASIKVDHPEVGDWPATYALAPLGGPGKYLHPQYLPELRRLYKELLPGWDLIVPLGNVAIWAILGYTGITRVRGYLARSSIPPFSSVLPTFHPSAVLRNWALRSIVITDFIKVRRILEGEHQEKGKEITIEPGLDDIKNWFDATRPEEPLAVDIETKPSRRIITCIGFGTKTRAISIPFSKNPTGSGNYWQTKEEEVCALKLVRHGLSLPNPKVWQNGMYDMQWIWRHLGFTPFGDQHDTMLIHHALQPEMSKGLEFLGSVYTDQSSWKGMRKKAGIGINSEKRDD